MSTRFVGSTVTRMRVKGSIDHPDLTGWLHEALTQNAFTDFPSPASGGTRDGFARADAPLETPDFTDPSTFYLTPYVSFAYREDVKKVPAARLKAAVNSAARAWCAENMRERCPKQVKLEIQGSDRADMLLGHAILARRALRAQRAGGLPRRQDAERAASSRAFPQSSCSRAWAWMSVSSLPDV